MQINDKNNENSLENLHESLNYFNNQDVSQQIKNGLEDMEYSAIMAPADMN